MIEVGEYVKTTDGRIGIFVKYSSRKEDSIYKSPFNCFIKLQGRKTPLQCCEDYIVKHSKNIIDLIEVGDIVNNGYIYEIGNTEDGHKWIHSLNGFLLFKKDIKTILTHEQYKQNCYTVERKSEEC